MEKLKNKISKLTNFETYAVSISAQTKTPIESSIIMKGFNELSKKYNIFTESEFDKDKDIIIIKNNEKDIEKQIQIQSTEKDNFALMWGINVENIYPNKVKDIFDDFRSKFNIYEINVEYIDMKFFSTSKLTGNHYKIIMDAFYKKSSIYNLFNNDKLIEDDIKIRSYIDDDRICSISIQSNVSGKEVIDNDFKNDLLKATIGIGQIQNFSKKQSFGEVVLNHCSLSLDFIIEKYLPNILENLNKELGNLKG